MKIASYLIFLCYTGLCWPVSALPLAPNGGRPEAKTCPAPALSRVTVHRVDPTETLAIIADKYNLNPATLMGMNPAWRQKDPPPGTEIMVPPTDGIRVELAPGQTWGQVAQIYNVPADMLFEVNGCEETAREIFVPGVNWSDVPSPTLAWGQPLPGNSQITLAYGWRLRPGLGEVAFHSGIDLEAPTGSAVLAVQAGVVAFAGERGTSGNLVVINHNDGKQTRYAHLGTIAVSAGQQVNQGDQIGRVGSTGRPDIAAPHLHFEVRSANELGWVAEDPTNYLNWHHASSGAGGQGGLGD
ncbi:MAG TPA: M23 family metallopeptidase [Oscillatoriaceae cyanobacterium M33_DOE_052]|uniref:M23 family metallopeptidase n=1 Tax=Planktothricoides sp. SpSt-374 TaxID=2282167 RepID=A0A7C3VPK9_9CYAN|nr:M23 family metallopeptidase [Oscillatoriaceae cyanobacterium M33_DOE_052]